MVQPLCAVALSKQGCLANGRARHPATTLPQGRIIVYDPKYRPLLFNGPPVGIPKIDSGPRNRVFHYTYLNSVGAACIAPLWVLHVLRPRQRLPLHAAACTARLWVLRALKCMLTCGSAVARQHSSQHPVRSTRLFHLHRRP